MDSAYRRGLPKAGPVFAVVLIGIVGSFFVPQWQRHSLLRNASVTIRLPTPREVPGLAAGYHAATVPVITEPAGAAVYSTGWGRTLLCASTPCEFPLDAVNDGRTLSDVTLELAGYQTGTASLVDLLRIPGATLMLTFGPVVHRDAVSLRDGEVHVSPGLPSEVVRRIVRQNFGRFKLCYESALRRQPTLEGYVRVGFVVDRSGAVVSATDHGSVIGDNAVVACVVRSFVDLSFPTRQTGVVHVDYTVAFAPPSPSAG